MKRDDTRKAMLNVLKGKPAERRPIWCMRQAGRYLPEYRKVRAQAGSFLDLCYNSELAAEVTLQPLRRYDLDAAIIFADILVVPHAMGNGLTFAEGEGPVLQRVTGPDDLQRLGGVAGTDQTRAVCRSIELVKSQLPPHVTMIGFCGAPWTVASYMLEGRGSDRQFALQTAYDKPEWFKELMQRLIAASIDYLRAQIEAGADTVQIFDSWAGDLSGSLFDELSIKPIAEVVAALKQSHPETPVIVFAKGAGQRHERVARQSGAAAIGIEQEADLDGLLKQLPDDIVVQGNLDPIALLCSDEIIARETSRIAGLVPRHRHIFNLGHGIKQQTRPEALAKVVETVRSFDRG